MLQAMACAAELSDGLFCQPWLAMQYLKQKHKRIPEADEWLAAARDYAAGEQAFISYGTAGNGLLLLAGGFVLAENRFDFVEVNLTCACDRQRLSLSEPHTFSPHRHW